MTSNPAIHMETEEFYFPPFLSQADWSLSRFPKSPEGFVDRDIIRQSCQSIFALTHQEKLAFPDRGFNLIITYDEPGPAWYKPTLYAAINTLYLDDNWDSYGARPINPTVINEAFHKLEDLLDDDTPPPSVVPTKSEGIQFEWHQSEIDIEIEVNPRDGCYVFFENLKTGEASEGSLDEHFQTIKTLLSEI